ncbi:lytic polysaccharide monooxygenase [Pseudomonas synxantha]|uniref:Lytic polysaccharide monooxygenase n=1 Tax=Pseudomonas synxantha TaxID=47883 RepID=A0ABS0UG57_9PSED|nr:lytic polysaccharide monooxygenase [Pseudomonas synxantha]MBI6564575.1 lytic polysaccharide monooxygenase [Pseudomonas synxantha]MBI6579226.1 lytic polysaccharide monooxygenase [Pseudomonas synxantha]MBI6643452.1 lytic polysaccharide monooxygenase [Pseudomonas synxantha]
MNILTKKLGTWALAAMSLLPFVGWTHGALDIPPSRAVNCQATGGYWQSEDGSSIVDRGCRESARIFNTPAGKVFAAQQWNEVAHIPGINNPSLDQIKAVIKDGLICSANDPRKASLDQPTPYWTKADVIPGHSLTMRLIGTAPHVPSKFYAFVSRAGFNTATDTLKWSDLVQLGQVETFTVARTDWQTPPKIAGAAGFFEITRTIPTGLSGNGLIVGIWVRNDPNGEFFISCADVSFQGGSIPEQFHNIGTFIAAEMQTLKPGDSVHFRIFDNKGERKELVDITHKITTANLAPAKWGKEIADKVDPAIARIGERHGQDIVFNQQNPLINATFATVKDYSQAMSIIAGQDPGPVDPAPPVARITGPTSLKSGQAFTFSGTQSTGANGPVRYEWAVPGMTGAEDAATVSGKAQMVSEPTPLKARLTVKDQENGKTDTAEFGFTVLPADPGQYPPYVPEGLHEAGKTYSHQGKNYKCKHAPWCSGSPRYYEPGAGLAWQEAWDEQ